MSWHSVLIQNSDVAELSAGALVDKFATLYREADLQKGVEVYHSMNDQGDHAYCFSPEASLIAPDLLADYKAITHIEAPDLQSYRRIEL